MPKAIDVTDSDTGDGSPNMKSWSSKRNLMASSMPARDVTVSLGEGFIWLHPPFNGRIKSLIRSFCRASILQGLDLLQRILHTFPDDIKYRQALSEETHGFWVFYKELTVIPTSATFFVLQRTCPSLWKGSCPTLLGFVYRMFYVPKAEAGHRETEALWTQNH